MAELVNQRIEEMINELEQMRRTELYNDEEIREIARKRKEFEYKIQRRVKAKEDYVQFIAYELALLEDINLRRKQTTLMEKRKDIEYEVAKRVNKVFKQFIYRFQDDIEVYFQYIKFCQSVGFQPAISGIISQMLQIHGDKPKMWQMASKWEFEEQKNLPNAREFLLKGIHRHPEADFLYIELFKIELLMAYSAENDEEKAKQLKRANVIWKNGMKNVNDETYLLKIYDMALKYDISEDINNEIRQEICSNRKSAVVWSYLAEKVLQGFEWEEMEGFAEEYLDDFKSFPKPLQYYMAISVQAMDMFEDEKFKKALIRNLLGLTESICTIEQKIRAIKIAFKECLQRGPMSDDIYQFGINMLKLENKTSDEEIAQMIDTAITANPKSRVLWSEKVMLLKSKHNEKGMLSVLEEAKRSLNADDLLFLWNTVLDDIEDAETIKSLYKKFHNCESITIMALKPKLLQKMYKCCGLKLARSLYEEFIRTPPIQSEMHTAMIEIESSQPTRNMKLIRKCYEGLVQHHGTDKIDVWMNYMKFETENGNAHLAPALYRRAIGMLKKELVDEFIKAQTLAKIK